MKIEIKTLLVIFIVAFPLALGGQFAYGFMVGDWEIGGYIRNESSLRVSGDTTEPIWSENIFQLEIIHHLSDSIDLFLMTRAYYDAVYDMKDGGFLKDRSVRSELRDKYALHRKDTQADAIREAYIDFYLEHCDIRIGKQQVVWGKTEAFKMLDIINPTDYRHFTQDAFEDSRITLWMAKFSFSPFKPTNLLELLVVPDVEPNVAPPYGHPFAFRATRATDPSTIIFREDHKGWRWSDLELGFRWGQNFGDFDYTLNYFYHWNDNPYVKFQGLDFSRGVRPILLLDYKRMHSIGGSFSKNFNRLFGLPHWVIRFESVFKLEDVGTRMTDVGSQPIRTDSFNYAIAIDHTFYRPYRLWGTGLSFTFQFFQSIILDYEHDYISGALSTPTDAVKVDEVENLFSMIFMANYLQGETLKPFLMLNYGDDGEWWISPQVGYELTEKTLVTLGAHIFSGNKDGFIGQMNKVDNIFLRIKFGI